MSVCLRPRLPPLGKAYLELYMSLPALYAVHYQVLEKKNANPEQLSVQR